MTESSSYIGYGIPEPLVSNSSVGPISKLLALSFLVTAKNAPLFYDDPGFLGTVISINPNAADTVLSLGYADDEAMSIIAEGFSKRSSFIDKLKGQGKDTSESKNLQQIIQAEIDNDKPLKARQFKDSKLQEQIIAYLNSLEDQLAVMDGTAATMCRDNKLPILVFDLADPDNIARAVQGENVGTLVYEG